MHLNPAALRSLFDRTIDPLWAFLRADGHADAEGLRIIRIGLVVVVLAFGGFGIWSAFAPLNGAVIVPAMVKVESSRKTVQHLEGGIVKAILVRSGDQVRQGQPLVVLEDVQASAMVEVLQLQLAGEMAKAARLDAERRRLERIEFPETLTARKHEPAVAAILRSETEAFEAKRQLLDGQVRLMRGQIVEVQEEARGHSAQAKSAGEGLVFLREQLRSTEALLNKQYVAYTKVLDIRRSVAEKEERRGEYLAQVAQAKQKISSLELNILARYDTYSQEAADKLNETEKKIADVQERLRPYLDTLTRQTITAPIDGEVVDMKVHTVGGVIAPREPLMDIVPQDARLVVEGKVPVENIDEVTVGQEVDVQLSAYNRRTTAMAKGKLIYVSADSLTDNTKEGSVPYYLVQIRVEESSLAALGKNIVLTPGMPITAYIKTRERTALDYLLEPITDTLRRALRES